LEKEYISKNRINQENNLMKMNQRVSAKFGEIPTPNLKEIFEIREKSC
jgi:hypothetical protein